jgi:hypothetical protein
VEDSDHNDLNSNDCFIKSPEMAHNLFVTDSLLPEKKRNSSIFDYMDYNQKCISLKGH